MEVKPGYKQTEVGVIPEEWDVKPLGAFVNYTNGKAHEQSISDSGRFVVVNSKFISTEGLTRKYSPHSFCPASRGEVLMVMSDVPNGRAIAKCYWVESDNTYTVNQRICILNPRGIDGKLLFYKLDRNPFYLAFDDGAKQTNLRRADVLACRLGIPKSEAEQRAIATALSDLDGLLGGLDRLIAKKRDLKQAAMQQLLTGQTRLTGFHGVWEVKRLGDGVALHSGHHVLAQHCNTQSEGVPYLTGPADFPEGRICHTKFTTRPSTICLPGDILVTVKGSGAGTIVLADAGYCISRQLMAIRVNDWDIRFIYYSLLQNAEQFRAASTGLIPGLSRSDILEQPLPTPPTNDEQTAIAQVLTDMDTELAALTQRREKTRALKQAMMQELLTGRTRLISKSITEVKP